MNLKFINILKEDVSNEKLRLAVYKYLERNKETIKEDPSEYVDDIAELFGLHKEDVLDFMVSWFVEVENEDPLHDIVDFEYENVSYLYGSENFPKLLERIGWFRKFFGDYNSMRDIETMGEGKNKKIFLDIREWLDLEMLFDDSNIAERVLSEDWAELFGWFKVDVDEYWDSINDESLQSLVDYMASNLSGVELDEHEIPPELEQAFNVEDETLTLNDQVIVYIRNNDTNDIMKFFIENVYEFEELKGEIESAYRWAYEGAAEDELFESLKNEIIELFGGEPKHDPKGNNGNGRFLIDVTSMYMDTMKKYMSLIGEMPQSYSNDFIDILQKVLDESESLLDVPNMDYYYPDHKKVEEHFNYNIQNNI